MWQCWCAACGKDFEILGQRLNKSRRSCGCKDPRNASPQLSGLNKVLSNYRVRAREDELRFELTAEYAKELFGSACFYCGVPPVVTKWKGKRHFAYNGIDRIDSDLGYVPGNVRSCCTTCNRAKNDKTDGQFAEWTRRFIAYQDRTPAPGLNPDAVLFWLNGDE